MIIFAAGGTSYGMAEESLAFYPLIIAAMIALGFDALSAVAVIMLGAGIGTMGSTINPFATGIATGIAGIPLADGIVYRIVILVVGVALGIWYVMRYATKVQKDPSKSRVADMKEANEKHFLGGRDSSAAPELTGQPQAHPDALPAFLCGDDRRRHPVVGPRNHALPPAGGGSASCRRSFMVMGVVIGFVGKMGEEGTVNAFIDGARDMLGVALVVAVARGISVVMTNGLIIDTVLYWCEQALSGLTSVAFINTIFLLYIPLSFLIPSSSGLATVTMPVMAPLASFAGIPEHLVVTAYQSASGLVNLVTPTFAVVTGGLAIGRISFAVWWKWVAVLVLILAVMCMVVLSIGALVG